VISGRKHGAIISVLFVFGNLFLSQRICGSCPGRKRQLRYDGKKPRKGKQVTGDVVAMQGQNRYRKGKRVMSPQWSMIKQRS
jgi:hypothetical protein